MTNISLPAEDLKYTTVVSAKKVTGTLNTACTKEKRGRGAALDLHDILAHYVRSEGAENRNESE